MMSPKDINDSSKDQINNKLKTLRKSALEKLTLSITKTLEDHKTLPPSTNVNETMIYNNNNLINNNNKNNNNNNKNDSNTSIKASNKICCNLIGKMINDVSTTTAISGCEQSKQTQTNVDDKEERTTMRKMAEVTITTTKGDTISKINEDSYTSSALLCMNNCSSEGGNIENNDDFHEENQMTSLNDVWREKLTVSVNYEEPQTLVDTTKQWNKYEKRKEARQEREPEEKVKGELLVTVNEKPLLSLQNNLRHKNITVKPLDDSYQKVVDLATSKARESKQAAQCELLEFKEFEAESPLQKDYIDTKNLKELEESEELRFPTLAERKALLKKEFFKELTPLSPFAAAEPFVKLKLNKRILKNRYNLKLKIPKDCKNQDLTKKEAFKPQLQSLVSLRKLDLEKKQQYQTAPQNKVSSQLLFQQTQFPKVKDLAKKFDSKMILPQTNNTDNKTQKLDNLNMERQSPLSDEGCTLGLSPYSSDDDNDSIQTTNTAIERKPLGNKLKDKVARSASSDSALGLDVDEPMDVSEAPSSQQQKRRMTLTVTDLPLRPALLPLAEPTLLPDSPVLETSPSQQTQIPSKVLLEERVVEILEDPRSGISSRRESNQSCYSDYPPGEMQGVRFVRTPSVVVSDYSDDINCGITLEEIEYFRAQRLRRRRSSLDTSGTEKDALDNNSDISASSSCSNLYYCGSTISALDGAECLVNGVRLQLERKTSDCSTCSVSGDEEQHFSIPEQPEDCQDITDMLNSQHITNKRSKKVGISGQLLTVDTLNPNDV